MNSLIAKWCFFLPVRLLRGEPIVKGFSFVREFELLKVPELKAKQLGLIRNQVRLAYQHIPYYKKHWSGILGQDGRLGKFDHFYKIPLLKKENIQRDSQYFINPGVKRFDKRTTSGSTGTPLQFIKDRQATAFMDAVMYNAYSWHGIKIGDRQARFWGMPNNNKQWYMARLKDFLMNRKRMSAFQLSDKYYKSFFCVLKKWKPSYCYGYPSLLCEFANFLCKHNLNLAPFNLKAVVCTGEQLSQEQRDLLEKKFCCRVVNEYGCTEIGVIGFECRLGNMHEMSSNVYFEILNNGVPVLDNEGEVVVTELHAKTSPFIRYKTGDRGIKYSNMCSCGLPMPLINILSGRLDDYILTPDGRKIYDAILAYTLKKGVTKFKAVQRKRDELEIKIVANGDLTDQLIKKYIKKFKENISPDMRFVLNKVPEIDHEPSGKLRYFKSEIH